MRGLLNLFLSLCFLGFVNSSYAANFTLTSTGFSNNSEIPVIYSCDGKNISPELKWQNEPAATKSYALTLTSPDWTAGFVYLWVLYNIPSNLHELKESANYNLPRDILVGNNYYYIAKYRGPCPPDGLSHHYIFTIYALDDVLDLDDGAESKDVMIQVNIHKLAEAHITAMFEHKN